MKSVQLALKFIMVSVPGVGQNSSIDLYTNMTLPRLLLFLYPFLIGVTVLAQPDFRSYICIDDAGNYTSDSTYKENLDTLLSSFSSDDAIDYGFYNSSAGQGADRVNAIGLCRGDVIPDACRSCLNDSRIKLANLCPNQKEARGWYDKCMLRYSNASIFGTSLTYPSVYIWINQNASDVEDFNRVLGNLMASLRSEAAAGDWRYKFATGQASVTSFGNIYGLMQCTPDLSELSCSNCLEEATNEIPTCCDGKIAGWIIKPSCNLRFEITRFYNFTAANAPPPAATTSPSPSSADLAPPPFTNTTTAEGKKSTNTGRTVILIVIPSAVVSVVLLTFIIFCLKVGSVRMVCFTSFCEAGDEDENVNNKSLQFDLATVKSATDDFSDANKLGQGGFGPVYKGKLSDGQEIAVKRLSSGSGQGEQEFKNEVTLVAKLQHRNLVRLLGFCLEGRERLLIYEFLPRTSLDKFIFDPIKRANLGWEKRYNIIEGIARGLLYLHEDSRLRIIHRDLKASNILLDAEMNPKISDFGMARLVIVDQSQGNTSRIVGTYGYMAPEYARHGRFSSKTDVYSFGVLLLEIVSGRSNNSFGSESSDDQNVRHLLSHAWRKWREGRAANLVDPAMRVCSTSNEIMRCIHIGLLCVQENEANRPTMASVVLMLNSYSLSLPLPSRPAFFMHSTTNWGLPPEQGDNNSTAADFTVNEASITELSAR